MNVELIYDRNCPNVAETRRRLMQALADHGRPMRWREWDQGDPSSPAYVRRFGSPTLLIGGVDVGGESPYDGHVCCRLYRGADGAPSGAPSVDQIVAALARTDSRFDGSRGWRSSMAAVPGIAVAFLPKLACPACWPAYAGLLSAVGLGFLLDTSYQLPLTAIFLIIAIGALAWRAHRRRGWGPAAVGLIASALVMVGKFAFDSDPAMYAGIALLVAASIWNAWPICRAQQQACRSCRSAQDVLPIPPSQHRSTS